MTKPKSFLDQETEHLVQGHFYMTEVERDQMQMHCIRHHHRSVSQWIREAVREKMARELEADKEQTIKDEKPLDMSQLLLRRK